MAAPKLTEEQRESLLTWVAAEYSSTLIIQWFADREWPELTKQAVGHYRKRYAEEIEQRRTDRRAAALLTGLALKAERVQRLKDHADALEARKWDADKNGRLWNEAAWRETLDEIAKEVGDRRQTVTNINLTPEQAAQLTDEEIDRRLREKGLL
jgi:hypothetical protein